MADSPLIIKSKEFALQIIKVCNYVKQTKKESVLTNQLIRSGTSVGANIREAFYGHGTADFIAKLQISLKEASETGKWIDCALFFIYGLFRQYVHLLEPCVHLYMSLKYIYQDEDYRRTNDQKYCILKVHQNMH